MGPSFQTEADSGWRLAILPAEITPVAGGFN